MAELKCCRWTCSAEIVADTEQEAKGLARAAGWRVGHLFYNWCPEHNRVSVPGQSAPQGG
jgi:hypothetical protein